VTGCNYRCCKHIQPHYVQSALQICVCIGVCVRVCACRWICWAGGKIESFQFTRWTALHNCQDFDRIFVNAYIYINICVFLCAYAYACACVCAHKDTDMGNIWGVGTVQCGTIVAGGMSSQCGTIVAGEMSKHCTVAPKSFGRQKLARSFSRKKHPITQWCMFTFRSPGNYFTLLCYTPRAAWHARTPRDRMWDDVQHDKTVEKG